MSYNLELFEAIIKGSSDRLCAIESKFFKNGDVIENFLTDGVPSTEVIVLINDYNGLVTTKLLYSLIKNMLYSNSDLKVYLELTAGMLKIESKITNLNKLDPKLISLTSISSSGVCDELRQTSNILIDKFSTKEYDMARLNIKDRLSEEFKLFELTMILSLMLKAILIVMINATIVGPNSKFNDLAKEFIQWMTNCSKLFNKIK